MPVTVCGVLVAFGAGMPILEAQGVTTVSWWDPGVARAVLGTAGYLVGIGLVGVARRGRTGPVRPERGGPVAARGRRLGARPRTP